MGGGINTLVTLGYIEAILKALTYIAVISISFKAVQTLNVYIKKNS